LIPILARVTKIEEGVKGPKSDTKRGLKDEKKLDLWEPQGAWNVRSYAEDRVLQARNKFVPSHLKDC